MSDSLRRILLADLGRCLDIAVGHGESAEDNWDWTMNENREFEIIESFLIEDLNSLRESRS